MIAGKARFRPNIIRIMDDSTIVQATSVHLSPGLRPSRIVLRELSGQFVTHVEFMHISVVHDPDTGYDNVVCRSDGYTDGRYFPFNEHRSRDEAHALATDDFEERAAKHL